MATPFETLRSKELVSERFIDTVKMHTYEDGTTIDTLRKGLWMYNGPRIPFLPFKIATVTFQVRAELDDSGINQTPGRNYDIAIDGDMDQSSCVSYYAPCEMRPEGTFLGWNNGMDYEIEPSEVESILDDVDNYVALGQLLKPTDI